MWVVEEIGMLLGVLVGYQVCFEDQSDDSILVKLMIDGIFLVEIQYDCYLECYDMLIVDEVYECSLNIDFFFGYLKIFLYWCLDLKLIIILVIIDLECFFWYFDGVLVIEVFGCIYLVEIWYWLLVVEIDEEGNWVEDDLLVDQGIFVVFDEIVVYECEVGKWFGDVLVFFFGEWEICDVVEMLCKVNLCYIEVLLLYV